MARSTLGAARGATTIVYYGHSSDRCPLRYDSELSKEARWKAAQDRHYAERAAARSREVPDGQARWFEQNGIPYVRDPIVGAILQ